MTTTTASQEAGPLFQRLSGGALLAGLLLVSAIAAILLSVSLLSTATERDRTAERAFGLRMVDLLERGLGDLAMELDTFGKGLLAAPDPPVVTIWRGGGTRRSVEREALRARQGR